MVGVSAEEVTLDCRTCGACCLSEYARLTTYIPLSEEDLGRFTASMRRRLVVLDRMGLPNLGVKRHGRGTQKICTQHVGRVGHKSACSIYERRPEACREFGEFVSEISGDLADGRVTQTELRRIEREAGELIGVVHVLRAHAGALAEQGRPAAAGGGATPIGTGRRAA